MRKWAIDEKSVDLTFLRKKTIIINSEKYYLFTWSYLEVVFLFFIIQNRLKKSHKKKRPQQEPEHHSKPPFSNIHQKVKKKHNKNRKKSWKPIKIAKSKSIILFIIYMTNKKEKKRNLYRKFYQYNECFEYTNYQIAWEMRFWHSNLLTD